jgi:hypothetical protein
VWQKSVFWFWCAAPGFGLLPQSCPPIAKKVAKAYGIESFGQIEQLRYTFNIDTPGLKVSRSWVREPKGDRVTYEGKDKAGNPVKVTYVRSQLNSQPDNVKKEIDPSFTNDQYRLIFPFHACWDSAATVEDTGIHRLPLGSGSARRVVVKYPSEGGYTPGDTWELYVGPDNRVQELVFHHGGNANPGGIVATWAGTRRPVLCSSQRTTAGHATASHFDLPLQMWLSNSQAQIPGSTHNKRSANNNEDGLNDSCNNNVLWGEQFSISRRTAARGVAESAPAGTAGSAK